MDEADSSVGEHSPFLEPAESSNLLEDRFKSNSRRFWVMLYIVGLIVTMDLPITLAGAPQTRLYEAIYCAAWYKRNDPSYLGDNGLVEEQYCKIDPVQADVSLLKGWMGLFDNLPGVLLAVPFGILADRYGRKWLVVMNVISLWARDAWMYVVCAFPDVLPIRLLWLESLGAIFGGGYPVARALIYVVINDVTPPPARASVFLRVTAASYVCFLLGPPIGALLLERDVWIPINIALSIHAFTALIALMLPETLNHQTESKLEASAMGMSPSIHTATNSRPARARSHSSSDVTTYSISNSFNVFFRWLRSNSRFLVRDWRILMILSLYLIYMNINALSDTILLQYISKRYSITFARASYFWSFEAVINMTLLLAALPALSTYLVQSGGYSILTRDVLLLRLSYLILAAGLLVVGLAPSLPIMTVGLFVMNCGTGGNLMMRLLLTSFVQPDEIAKMYSAISILETAGSAISGPLTAGLFNVGLGRAGGAWLGLPFLGCAALFAVATLALWATHLVTAKGGER